MVALVGAVSLYIVIIVSKQQNPIKEFGMICEVPFTSTAQIIQMN